MTDMPSRGTRWADEFGGVWVCEGVTLDGVVQLRRTYVDRKTNEEIHCSAPTQLELFWRLYRAAPEDA